MEWLRKRLTGANHGPMVGICRPYSFEILFEGHDMLPLKGQRYIGYRDRKLVRSIQCVKFRNNGPLVVRTTCSEGTREGSECSREERTPTVLRRVVVQKLGKN